MQPPRDESELLERARGLGGRTVIEVAAALQVPLPPSPQRAKGFVGQLVERALGGACNAADGPDFPHLGIELKTLPVDGKGRVRESTFVCTAPLALAADVTWETSRARRKLGHVLFVVVEADPAIKPGRRRFGAAWLWRPSPAEEDQLARDWREITGRIGAGQVESIDATVGRWLQLRPKGANRRATALAYDADGVPFRAPARGFYLRTAFTRGLVENAALAPSAS